MTAAQPSISPATIKPPMESSRRESRAPASPVTCSICDSTFVRREHLIRHSRIHTREKPFQCPTCEKCFARQDVLSRHIASCHDKDETPRSAALSSRACDQCASSRVRCSRHDPCRRCVNRHLVCRYPTRRKRRQTSSRNDSSEGAADSGDNAATPSAAIPDLQPIYQSPPDAPPVVPDAQQSAFPELALDSQLAGGGGGAVAGGVGGGWAGGIGGDMGIDAASSTALYDFTQPVLGISGVNWMSPRGYSATDWDSQLTDFLSSKNNFQAGGGAGDGDPGGAFPFYFNDVAATMPRAGMQTFNPPRTSNTGMADYQSMSMSGSSPSAVGSATSASTGGRYYVDGTGSRAPFGGRSRQRSSVSRIESIRAGSQAAPASEEPPPGPSISSAAYDEMIHAVQAECRHHRLGLNADTIPSHTEVQSFVRCYFDHFHPVFPFLRRSTFSADASGDWRLLLAVSMVGSRYMRPLGASDYFSDFSLDILHRCLEQRMYGLRAEHDDSVLFTPGTRGGWAAVPDVPTLQAGVLAILCMLHSGRSTYIERALVERHYLIEACHSLDLLSAKPTAPSGVGSKGMGTRSMDGRSFASWCRQEFDIRVGLMIWFVDSICHYEFNAKRLMELAEVQARLPVHEEVWESTGDAQFQPNWEILATATLPEALDFLYTEKRVPRKLGDFSTTLLINAIYIQTKEVQTREQAPTNGRLPPSAPRLKSRPGGEGEGTWIPNTPTMSRWRNSACDCLDVLHWSANSKAAGRSGAEHHTILHLHLSRLILLAPAHVIQTFATTSSAVGAGNGAESGRYTAARDQMLQWVIGDQFKARLCMVHCGALYWHVRRYSCDSLMEPYAIYLATLLLWAYCASVQLLGQGAMQAYADWESPSAQSPSRGQQHRGPEPAFLHLDRPLDDELVQTFVQKGHMMAAYVKGVGNIHEAGAPARVLAEGIRLQEGDDGALEREQAREEAGGHGGGHGGGRRHTHTWGIEVSFRESLRQVLTRSTWDGAGGEGEQGGVWGRLGGTGAGQGQQALDSS